MLDYETLTYITKTIMEIGPENLDCKAVTVHDSGEFSASVCTDTSSGEG